MRHAVLREYIEAIVTEGRQQGSAVLVSSSSGDLSQALLWLRANGILRNASGGTTKRDDGTYRMSVRFYGPKSALIDTVKARYGSFIDVV